MAFSYLFLMLLVATFTTQLVYAKVPAVFIFGDSTADVGTNTLLRESLARADFPYYGIDFPNSRPTGRFSNGLNSADIVAKLMGFNKSPQPFLFLLRHPKLLQKPAFRGVNFASGGSGLFDDTGKQFRKVVSLSQQIRQFNSLKSYLTWSTNIDETEYMLSKSVFCISTGSNDIFQYFATNRIITAPEFISALLGSYVASIKALYHLGARKFGIISIPPVGCCPANRLFNETGGCLEGMNDLSRGFYLSLSAAMYNLKSEFPDMKYSLGNTYDMTINFIQHASSFNITNVDTACCGSGRLNAEVACNATTSLCSARNQYLFWDLFHPTEVVSERAAKTLYDGGLEFVAPINFRKLAEDC